MDANQYKALFETMPLGVVFQDTEGSITSANPAAEKILGLTLDQMQGRTSIDPRWKSIHEDGSPYPGETHPAMETLKTGKTITNKIMGVFHPIDGNTVWIRITATPIFEDDSKKVSGVYTTFEDISEQKDITDKSNLWLENSPICTKIVDLDFNLQYMSASGIRDLKIDDINEFYGKPYPLHFYPDSFKNPMQKNLKKAKETGEIITQEAFVLDVEGEKIWYHSTIVPVFDESGDLDYIMVVSLEETDRIHAQKAQKLSEYRWQSLTENSPNHIMVLDKDYRIEYINRTVPDLTIDQVIGKSNFDFVPQEYHNVAKECYKRVMKSKEPDDYETVYITTDGEEQYFTVSISPLMDSNGDVDGFISTSRNITGRKITELTITKQQELMEKTQELGQIGTWELDLINDKLYWTDENCRIFGVEPGTVANYEIFLGKVHPDDRDYVNEEWMAGVAGKPYDIVHRLLIEGEISWVREKADLYFNDEGEVISAVGFTQDITQRKQAERETKESAVELERFFDLVPDMIAIASSDGYFKRLNTAWTANLGFSSEELMSKPFSEFIHPDDVEATFAEVDKQLKGGNTAHFVNRYRNSKGGYQWLEWRATPAEGDLLFAAARDITERKKAEQELSRLNDQLRTSIEHMPNAYILWDRDQHILEWNNAAEKIFGYTRDEILGKNAVDFIVPEPVRHLVGEVMSKLQIGEVAHYSEKDNNIRKDGKFISCEWHNTPIADNNGSIIAILTLAQDITERMEAEEKLNKTLDVLKDSQKIAQLGSWYLDVVTNEVTWTEELYKMYGFDTSVPPPSYTEHMKLFTPESWDRLSTALAKASSEGISYELELETVREDGSHGWMWVHGEAVTDSDGAIIGLKGAAQNIGDRKLAELELRETREALTQAQKSAGIGSWEFNSTTKSVKWSDELYNILEFSPDVTPDFEQYYSRVHPDDLEYVKEVGARVYDNNESAKAEYRLLTPSGKIKYISTSGEQVLNENGDIVKLTGIVQDITESKQAEEDKLNFEKQILQTQKLESLGVLAGGIAHDFNNILMGILGYADLALTDLDPIDPAREFVQGINDSTRKAAGLVKQMLAYSGKGKFSLEPIDLNHLIEDTIQMLDISISKNAIMKFNFSDNPVFLEGDPSQIRQIIMNLVINASDAVGKKSGVIALTTGSMYCDRDYIKDTGFEAQIAHSVEIAEGMYTFVEVSDTGTGMSKETLVRIFEPFYTTKFTGRGLGLSAVLGIVRGHHGMVTIYSEEGKGSTFKILFPLFEHAGDSTAFESVGGIDSDWQGSGTFLIADDEEAVRTVGKHMLEKLGFQVLTAADGREAVETFKKHSADVVGVLLDLTMPHKDGAEVFREIRKLNSDIKVILTSGYNEQDATQQFVGKGLAGFIQKPYVGKELVGKIIEVMEPD